ncbi:MAG: guanylate kinase [Gemmatimonadota bacterium]
MSLDEPPFVVVIAAPSGTGKTTLTHALVERNEGVVFSISATTRAAREYERPGVDYHFVDDPEFDRMIECGELVEWAEVHGERYGTPRGAIEAALERGRTVVLDIDIQGARQIRRAFPEDAVLIFVLPPSGEELNRRLAGRGTESEVERRRRIVNARRELPAVRDFDYVVLNDEFERAVRALESILAAERRRVKRQRKLVRELERLDRELGAILEGG